MSAPFRPTGPVASLGGSIGPTSPQARLSHPAIASSAVVPPEVAVDARTGTGSLDTSASLAGTGTKKTTGTGTVATSASFTNAGRKAASGTGSVAPSAALTSTGKKAASGSATLAASAGFTIAARRATGGTGALTLLTTIASTATPARKGSASLALAPTLAASGDKAESSPDRTGTGTLALVATLTGTGLSSEAPVVADPGSWGTRFPWDAFTDPEHHEGSGVISLHARLAGAGFKSYESDDELVLALAA